MQRELRVGISDAAGTKAGIWENCIGKFTVETNEPAYTASNNAQETHTLRVCVCAQERKGEKEGECVQ